MTELATRRTDVVAQVHDRENYNDIVERLRPLAEKFMEETGCNLSFTLEPEVPDILDRKNFSPQLTHHQN